MADADAAERNACEAIDFSGDPPSYLMCWFHVMQNIKKLCRPLTTSTRRLVYRHMYRMHYARDEHDFEDRKSAAAEAWQSVPECVKVSAHIQKQWLSGRYAAWQCFRSPPRYAKTNNPLETFNADIKREYTEHELLSLNCLFKQLLAMAKHRAVRSEAFRTEPRPGHEMIRRYKTLRDDDCFQVAAVARSSILFMLEGSSDEQVHHIVQLGWEFPPTRSASGEPSDVRIAREADADVEVHEQPKTGWAVNAARGHCNCRTWIKFGYCVHLIACRDSLGLAVEGLVTERVKFVNKRRKKSQERQPRVGAALSLT